MKPIGGRAGISSLVLSPGLSTQSFSYNLFGAMDQIASPRHRFAQAPDGNGAGTTLYQRRSGSSAGPIELLPNPDFVFPQPSPDSSFTKSSNANPGQRPMSLQAMSASRRNPRAGSTQRKSVSTLPDFTFNPSGTTTSVPATTPPHSPLPTTPTTPSRGIGHRRGGSEFIGGDGKTGRAGLMSSSPTKGDGVLPVPPSEIRHGPPTGRRGHAHRRSGAISCHDLSSILQPRDANAPTRSGSAPVTPMDLDTKDPLSHAPNRATSQPSLRSSSPSEMSLFRHDNNSSPQRPPSRARVGFSDRIEYIRPLSTISSETESSLSTTRGHSASGSLSSVISAVTSSPPARLPKPSLNTTFEDEEMKSRPSTAGVVLDAKSKGGSFGGDVSASRPMSAVDSGSPISPNNAENAVHVRTGSKKKGFFRMERRSDPLQTAALRTSNSEPFLAVSLESPLPSPTEEKSKEDTTELDENPLMSEKKASRKPRKVKSWASAIIPRLSKYPNSQKTKSVAERPPTPPRTEDIPVADNSSNPLELNFDCNFDVDDTVTIVTPPAIDIPQPRLDTQIALWEPRDISPPDLDAMSPVIDLDAALGPFNTPRLGPNGRSNVRGFSASRRQLHSAGMQPHRRTESAPELAPFEFRNSAISTNSTMADVFEEEEEDEENAPNSQPSSKSTSIIEESTKGATSTADEEEVEQSVGIQVVEADNLQEGSLMNWNFDDGLGIKQEKTAEEPKQSNTRLSITAPGDSTFSPATTLRSPSRLSASPVEVVEDYEEPRTSSLTRSSDSTVTPTMPADDAKEPQPLMHLSLPVPQQALMTPDTFTSSSFSSPDFSCSQASLDTPRLGTAASSVTDNRTINSISLGEPGPEFRISVDDVPSLTSSRSTMTSGLHGAFPLPLPLAPGERSSSVSSIPSLPSTISERRRKRSSIASLSRLMNGSFGERSKLSIEQKVQDNDDSTKPPKAKRTKRISRLIHFWKPKESS